MYFSFGMLFLFHKFSFIAGVNWNCGSHCSKRLARFRKHFQRIGFVCEPHRDGSRFKCSSGGVPP